MVCVIGGGGHFGTILLMFMTLSEQLQYMYIFYWVETTDAASLIIQLICIIGHKTKVIWKELGCVWGRGVLGHPLFQIGFHVRIVIYV